MIKARYWLATIPLLHSTSAWAHEVPEEVRLRLAHGGAWLDYLWTGAEHMLTGYDHLLFLLGVVFFLRHFLDIVKFITAFTLGHTLVLLGASIAGVSADHYLVDAFIAFTVMYKGFENLGGFDRLGTKSPNLLAMVFLVGLIHGAGLSSQVQLLTGPEDDRWLANLLWFNVGVELGQVAALIIMISVIRVWRTTSVWPVVSRLVNSGLVFLGFLLLLYQLHGYLHERDPALSGAHSHAGEWHSHGDGPPHQH